jgi:TolB-like protein
VLGDLNKSGESRAGALRKSTTMTIPTGAADGPSESDARAALARIVASETFRSSPQLGAFLRFIVEEALAGRGASLKGYTIGVEALGRDPRFNPQIDPIVRVEATRLRRAMERYYSGDGIDDPVAIELPRGSYVPVFSRRRVPAVAAAPAAAFGAVPGRLTILGIALAVGLLGACLGIYAGKSGTPGSRSAANIDTQPTANGLPRGNGLPTINIESLRVLGAPRSGSIVAGSLTEKLRDAFARFDTINVSFGPRQADNGASSALPSPAARHADYRLSGSIEYGETATTILFQLIDTAEGTIAWSRTFDQPAAGSDPSAAEEAIVGALANALLQSYGVIRARDRAKHLVSSAGDPRYRCILEAADSLRSVDPAEHDRARACLERLTSVDPGFAVGFEFLAVVYFREYLLDFAANAGDPPPLDRALRAARHAIELAPASGRAYQMLFVVQYARRDIAAAFASGDKAMALNKYDMLTVAEYGGRLIMTGNVERGMAMLGRSTESGSIHPSWHHFYLFLGNYLTGDMKEAAFQAEQITADDYPLGLVAKAIAARSAGNKDLARRTVQHLLGIQPAWRDDARRLLEKSIYEPAIVDRLLHDLAACGLQGNS